MVRTSRHSGGASIDPSPCGVPSTGGHPQDDIPSAPPRAARGAARAVRLALLAAATAAALFVTSPAIASAASPPSLAERVVAEARSHVGAPYAWGSTGPRAFDCSGLVYRVFADVGQLARIGGNRGGYGLYEYFVARHLASRTNPEVGDLVAWGAGSHVGIYIGNGMAISALVSGVRVHGVFAVTTPFTAYLHTHLSGSAEAAAARAAGTHRTTARKPAAAKIRYAVTALLVRAGPSTTRARIEIVAARTRLAVVSSRRDGQRRVWYEVRLAGGRRGWVAGWLTRG